MTWRRATLALLLAPVLCGLLAAGTIATAWVLLGSPTPAQGAVWFQVTKLGAARATGGPPQPFFIVNTPSGNDLRAEADAVSSVVGVPLNYVIRANFPNFQQMVDEIGGIEINIPTAMDDDFSGAHFAAGPTHLNGEQALQFSRDRHSFSNGDLARTSNQGLLIVSALQTLQQKNPSAGDTVHLIANLGRHVKLDGIGISDLFHMGELALTFDAANIKNVMLPVADGGGSNLIKSAGADSLLADFADDAVLQSH